MIEHSKKGPGGSVSVSHTQRDDIPWAMIPSLLSSFRTEQKEEKQIRNMIREGSIDRTQLAAYRELTERRDRRLEFGDWLKKRVPHEYRLSELLDAVIRTTVALDRRILGGAWKQRTQDIADGPLRAFVCSKLTVIAEWCILRANPENLGESLIAGENRHSTNMRASLCLILLERLIQVRGAAMISVPLPKAPLND